MTSEPALLVTIKPLPTGWQERREQSAQSKSS